MTIRFRPLLNMIFLTLLLVPCVYARGDISLDQAVRQAKERVGGRVISAETQERDGRQIHNIRILTNGGKVRRLRINADGGRRQKGK